MTVLLCFTVWALSLRDSNRSYLLALVAFCAWMSSCSDITPN